MNSPEIGEKKVFLVKNIKHRYRRGINNIYRGHAQTMWTVFWTFLTPLPPLVDSFTKYALLVKWTFHEPPSPHGCPHGLCMTPYMLLRYVIYWDRGDPTPK